MHSTTSFYIIFEINFNISAEICEPSYSYIVSQRGHCQLTHNGFRYRKDKDSKKGIRWRCASSRTGGISCKGKAFTYTKNEIEYATFSRSQSHDHQPYY